jgi:hypothetical protein
VVVISKRSPWRRNAIAPERRQTWRSTTSAAQPGGASRALTTSTARRQSSSKASVVFAMATSEPSRRLPDAARRIASDPFAKRTVVRRARVGIGRKPFAQRKEVATGFDHGKATVFTADGGGAAVRGDQHIGLGRANHQHDGAADQQGADEPQRSFEEAEHDESGRA